MPRKKKDIYRKYSDAALKSAVEAVKSSNLSIRSASKEFGIPKSTILDHVQGHIASGAKMGRPAALSQEVESQLVHQALEASERGFGMSSVMLMAKTGRVVRALKLQTPFKNNIPGTMWWRGLKRRHPELVIRKPEKMSSCRGSMMNRVVLEKYFDDLSETLTSLGLTSCPTRIWNADEKGFQMEHSPVSVCARKGSRALPGRTSNSRESISTLVCVNAGGATMPPLCVVKGKTRRSLDSFATEKAPPGTVWTWQEKAWMTDVLGQTWFKEVFLKHCGAERPQLLILDSHSSHEVLELLEAAKQENIHVMALPPHTTAYLQPLDRTVFGPLSKAYNNACTNFMSESPMHTISKSTWPELFTSAWNVAMTRIDIQSGFRSCGIYPLNPNAVPVSAFSTSQPFEVEITQSVAQSSSSQSVAHSSSSESVAQSSSSVSVAQSSSSESVAQSSSSVSVAQSSLSVSITQSSSSESVAQSSSSVSVAQSSSSESVAQSSLSESAAQSSSSHAVARSSSSHSVTPSTSLRSLAQSPSVPLLSLSPSVSQPTLSQSVAHSSLPVDEMSSVFVSDDLPDQGPSDDYSHVLADILLPNSKTVPEEYELVSAEDFAGLHTIEIEKTISEIFTPAKNVKKTKEASKRKLTTHRLLTSDLIMEEKRREREEKLEKEKQKEDRKKAKELKQKDKASKTKSRKKECKKKNGEIVCCVCLLDDDNADTENVNWAQCDKCNAWVHFLCIPPKMRNDMVGKLFFVLNVSGLQQLNSSFS